ncbi:hypothetical protein [Bacillus thuringiensis]|uniref:hypothetical protein n=1 Tax=Bacillus thuringiensis TaxID=1428 RepID=UPI002541E01B|nr:hypothetical protein [Bacillus thuringiensis]WIG14953.1 hypothetical protein QOM09_12980 [Bacillus thuringiensis]
MKNKLNSILTILACFLIVNCLFIFYLLWGLFLNGISPYIPEKFTAFISAILVFISGQFILKVYIEPIIELKKIIGKIASHLMFYRNAFGSLPTQEHFQKNEEVRDKYNEISKSTRLLAADLTGVIQLVPFNFIIRRIFDYPDSKTLKEVRGYLIRLSNTIYKTEEIDGYNEIKENIADIDLIQALLKLDKNW